MNKALQYLKTEYGYEEYDLIQQFGPDYETFKNTLEEPQNVTEERMLYFKIDNFMSDHLQTNKKRRRAY